MNRHPKARRPGRSRTPDPFSELASARGAMLSSQVEDALRLALATLDDPRLDDAVLVGVVPDGVALRATVECPSADLPSVERALERAMPRIRYELASEVHRKRLPQVRFVVLPSATPTSGAPREGDE